jgi:hypothetical protein
MVAIRIANPLRIAFVFMCKQTLNMETARFIFTSNKYLTSYGRDEQEIHIALREKSLISSSTLNFMTIHSQVC